LGWTLNAAAVNFYFYQKYIGRDLTIFENVFKLLPGHSLTFDLAGLRLTVERYYNLEAEVVRQQALPLAERLEAVESVLVDAVESRLVADVPVGAFLSGGVDSSLISGIISRRHKDFKTFSIGFKEASYDERRYSQLVADHLGTDHTTEVMDVDETVLRRVLEAMDEPFGDASVFPTVLLSEIARRKVTVCLSGDAADEIFAGYDTYKGFRLAEAVPEAAVRAIRPLVERLPVSDRKVTLGFKAKRFVRDFGAPPVQRHLDWMATFNDAARQPLLGGQFIPAAALLAPGEGRDLLSLQLNDIHNYLAEDILKKVDLASMLHSLEVRVPFLDYRLVPLVLSLPASYKIRGLTTKWLLKRIAAGYMPARIVRRPKRGFTSPISQWIKSSEWIRRALTEKDYYGHGLVDATLVQRMLGDHLAGKQDWARHLWLVFVFNHWWMTHGRP
jgi:asparagine synthase (glutamine-hydrolysing)